MKTLMVIVLILLSGCYYDDEEWITKDVKYEVTGTASNVTISGYKKDGHYFRVENQSLPWGMEWEAKGADLQLNVLNNTANSEVTAKIYVDGKEIDGDSCNNDAVIKCQAWVAHLFI